MHSSQRRPRSSRLKLGLAAVLTGLFATACGGGGGGPGNSETIELTVGLFGDFGYHELYKKFEKQHPKVKITENVAELADHHDQLATHLATGSGAPDVAAIEEGYIAQFKAQPRNFVNMADFGAGKLEDREMDWAWQMSVSRGGAKIGLRTDVGGLAMCYRVDLFDKAGLPTDRDQVAKLWPDWESYIDAGKDFRSEAPANTYWFDSAGQIFNAIIAQAETGYYTRQNEIVVDSNPAVKDAFELAVSGIQAGESAGLAPFSPEWNTGLQQATFATLPCPAWMMGHIQNQAKGTKGKWDIASIPGEGGNWGGSYLTVPAQSEHPELAYELAKFLTSPSSETHVFRETGNLPSIPALYSKPEIANFETPFFNDAPVGEIFTTAAENLEPQYLGALTGDIEIAIGDGLTRIERGNQSPEQAWQRILADIGRMTS